MCPVSHTPVCSDVEHGPDICIQHGVQQASLVQGNCGCGEQMPTPGHAVRLCCCRVDPSPRGVGYHQVAAVMSLHAYVYAPSTSRMCTADPMPSPTHLSQSFFTPTACHGLGYPFIRGRAVLSAYNKDPNNNTLARHAGMHAVSHCLLSQH